MSRRRITALLCLALCLAAPMAARAETSPSPSPPEGWRVRLRLDTVLRWAPRYVVRIDGREIGTDQLYWERVDQLPLYQRANLDATWQGPEGWSADIHTSAWGALDLTFHEGGGIAAGDFALLYGRGSYGPVSLWLGRRFVPWGPPGGMHIDGGGVEARTRFGLAAEAVIGRPVTPIYGPLTGPHLAFEGATLAYGARLGYRYPGRVSASLAYVERWAEGIAADRLISVEATAVPHRRIDLRGSLIFDPADVAVEQATVQLYVIATDFLEMDLGYAHTDPSRLLPRWSILSVFATGIYHEGSLGGTFTVASNMLLRVEGAFRWYLVPGREDEEAGWWGYRVDATIRWLPSQGRFRFLLGASRRADELVGLTLMHGSASARVGARLILAVEAAVALDDERHDAKDSYLGRASGEVAIGSDWFLGATIDLARTPYVDFEARGMVRASWRPSWSGGGR